MSPAASIQWCWWWRKKTPSTLFCMHELTNDCLVMDNYWQGKIMLSLPQTVLLSWTPSLLHTIQWNKYVSIEILPSVLIYLALQAFLVHLWCPLWEKKKVKQLILHSFYAMFFFNEIKPTESTHRLTIMTKKSIISFFTLQKNSYVLHILFKHISFHLFVLKWKQS